MNVIPIDIIKNKLKKGLGILHLFEQNKRMWYYHVHMYEVIEQRTVNH